MKFTPKRFRHLASILLVGCVGCAGAPGTNHFDQSLPNQSSSTEKKRATDGKATERGSFRAFTITSENDAVAGEDGGYSNGLGMTVTSHEITEYNENSLMRRIADFAPFTPRDEASERYLSFTLGHQIFTPDELTLRNPPPDEQPYAGLLFLDTALVTKRGKDTHLSNLRLGWVGPETYSEHTQEYVHKIVDTDDPKGWDKQLKNEPIVNLDYTFARSVADGWFGDDWHWDTTPFAQASVGNFFTGVGAGVFSKVGFNSKEFTAVSSLRSGSVSLATLADPDSGRWQFFVFGAIQGFAVARYLPLDGNTFTDSRNVDKKPLVGIGSAGLSVGKGRFRLGLQYSAMTDTYESQSTGHQFGTVSLTWFF